MNAKIVTAYVPLGTNPYRSDATYREIGKLLTDMDVPLRAFVDYPVQECWLWNYLESLPQIPKGEGGGDPGKNTLTYHIVQHSKIEWMCLAAQEDPEPDVFVWLDYGIFKNQTDVKEEHVRYLLDNVNDETIAMPGYMSKAVPFGPGGAHWRFCGTVLVCPRKYLYSLDKAVRETAMRLIAEHQAVSFEVNTWAEVERQNILPIRQYSATHNSGMLTHYLDAPVDTMP